MAIGRKWSPENGVPLFKTYDAGRASRCIILESRQQIDSPPLQHQPCVTRSARFCNAGRCRLCAGLLPSQRQLQPANELRRSRVCMSPAACPNCSLLKHCESAFSRVFTELHSNKDCLKSRRLFVARDVDHGGWGSSPLENM